MEAVMTSYQLVLSENRPCEIKSPRNGNLTPVRERFGVTAVPVV
jgi:hypothetical protein